jgi:predicted RNase H-like HicB family nuclease
MASKKYDVIIERDEDGVYVAHVPELPGCHTQGASVQDVMKNIVEATELYLSVWTERENRGKEDCKPQGIPGRFK